MMVYNYFMLEIVQSVLPDARVNCEPKVEVSKLVWVISSGWDSFSRIVEFGGRLFLEEWIHGRYYFEGFGQNSIRN